MLVPNPDVSLPCISKRSLFVSCESHFQNIRGAKRGQVVMNSGVSVLNFILNQG